ncbi:MAG: CDP-alcohol phosphatidyltransferase family protein [Alphaproteobacteria bacterium]
MNLPNLISLARLLSVPVAVWLILEGRMSLAFWLFVAAGISDAVDGFIAKHFDARSTLGSYLDPLADKALLVSVYVTLGHEGYMEIWLVILVVSRDVMIIGGAILSLLLMDSFRIGPSTISKINTAAQIGLAALILAKQGLGLDDHGTVMVLTLGVAATTVSSGTGYLISWFRQTAGVDGRS